MTYRYIKRKRTATHSFALYEQAPYFVLEAIELETGKRFEVQRMQYFGEADRIAVRAMMYGTLATVNADNMLDA